MSKVKIAVIVKKEFLSSKAYTTHRQKVSYHNEDLFLSNSDKAAIALAVTLKQDGQVDLFSFENGVVGERVLREGLSYGADTATLFKGINPDDPLNSTEISQVLAKQFKKQGYDLILTGESSESANFAARLADMLAYNFYDQISYFDTNKSFESQLDRGSLTGTATLPAVLTITVAAKNPKLPSFLEMEAAQKAEIKDVEIKVSDQESSEIIADQRKGKKLILNLDDEPDAVEKLVEALKQDGILK